MRTRLPALKLLTISLPIGIVAVVLGLMGKGMIFQPGAGAHVDFASLWMCILLTAGASFLFGWVRYGLSGAVALGLGLLHDLLITFALTSIISLVIAVPAAAPALIVSTAVFSFCLHVPVIREARTVLRGASSRDTTRQMAAEQAVKDTMKLKLFTASIFVLLVIAFVVSGGAKMWGAMLPLLMGLLVACVSSRFLVPNLWTAISPKRKGKR